MMKFAVALVAALAASTNAHTIFVQLEADGKTNGA